MEPIDCYFFIDLEKPLEERGMSCLHVECRNEHFPDTGWFYKESKEGYGPWDFICHHCGKYIHKAINEELS